MYWDRRFRGAQEPWGAALTMANKKKKPDGDIGSELVRENASFAEIVTQFVAGLNERVARMEDAIRAADFDALRVAAHQLKGSGGGYGYPILTERAAELERHARNQALDPCLKAIDELKTICERVVVDSAE